MKQADVIIIGAGLMDSSTALWLARAGKKALLLEKEHHPCHASAVNAGGVRRLNRDLEEIPLAVAAMKLWHRLPSIVGSDCGFEPVGHDYLPIKPEGLSMMVTARTPRFIRPVIGVHGRKLSFKQTANGTVVIGGVHRAILDMDQEKTVIDFGEMQQSAATVLEYFPVMNIQPLCGAGPALKV